MFIRCELLSLILALTLGGQVHTGKIIGGQVAQSRPYMVLLKFLQAGKITSCGGFLLNADFVMTAAHCQAYSYEVLLGVNNFWNTTEQQSLSVEKSYPHEDYKAAVLGNDIMLLKLSSQPILSKSVKPIAIACQGDEFLPKSCSTSGWGRTDENEIFMSRVLMEANVTLINNKQCNEAKLYCSNGEPRPAPGDSGGPLVCEGEKAYGVVSAGLQYTNSPVLYGYTKIAEYSNWIHSIMGSSDTCNN